jgi:hypothetical protein
MQSTRAFWPVWAERLQDWKMDSLAAWLLEAGGPFTLLSAQALYIASPFLGGTQVKNFARMLEQNEEIQAFISFLQENAPS